MSKVDGEAEAILDRISEIQRELELLKRDLLQGITPRRKIASLYGAVKGADITDDMIERAKKSLFVDTHTLPVIRYDTAHGFAHIPV